MLPVRLGLFCFIVGTAFGCAPVGASAPKFSVRVLSSEGARLPLDEPVPVEERRPRIGAPGGSGPGARRVQPAQSGNETVGGFAVGMGSTGRRG
jgi:hypothetical protein